MRRLRSGGALLLLATALGVLTAAAIFAWLDDQDTPEEQVTGTTAGAPTEVVVVARRDIAPGVVLTAAMIELREVPRGSTLEGAFIAVDEVTDRVARYPLLAGEQVREARLVSVGDEDTAQGQGLAFSIPPGMRAISVAISEVSGAGGLIVPGDRVDILVATDFERLFSPSEADALEDEAGDPIVLTLLQDVLVLAVAQEVARALPGGDPSSRRDDEVEVQPSAGSVTLAVTPEDAQTLFFATQEGKLGLLLRAFGDGTRTVLNPELKLQPADGIGVGLRASR